MYLINLFEKIKSSEKLLELFNIYDDQSKKGYLFEKLWDIIIKTNYSLFTNDKYVHYQGNINNPSSLNEITNFELYFKQNKVFSKNDGGASDITLKKKDGTWVFITSKFPKTKEDINTQKTIKYFEIQDILAVLKKHSDFYENKYEIYLLVHDKHEVENIINRSQRTNRYLKDSITRILDFDDLNNFYKIFRKDVLSIDINQINEKLCNKLVPLVPRFHQKLTTIKILKFIKEGEKQFLYGWKCRSGKTYGIGYLLSNFYRQYNSLNALIITPAPTETIPQFTNDLFHKFRDFQELNIIEIKNGEQLKNTPFNKHLNNIIVCSKQLLDKYIDNDKIDDLKNLNLDFIVFDENHNGGTTEKSSNILTCYSSSNTIKIYLTATYHKPLLEWCIPDKCQFYWDIEDEQFCKKRDVDSLIKKHGDIIKEILNEDDTENELSSYDKMPNLELITTMMDSMRYDKIKLKISDSKYGFSMETLFSLNKNQSDFNYPNEVQKILAYISGSNKEKDFSDGDKSIFGRIKTISNNLESRTLLNNRNFTSQLWFLPFGSGMNIDKVSECLEKVMLNDTILKQYQVLIINSKKKYKLNDLKKEISTKEILAKKHGCEGLIILAGNQCSLGITLPLVDCVFLLNNTLSCDRIFQMMYRCMSESQNGYKKCGFVVDLNISRVLNTILDYNVYQKDMNIEDKLKYIINHNLCNIDSDYFESKETKTIIIDKLIEIWKKDPVNYFKTLLKKVEQSVIELDSIDQKMLNQSFVSSNESNKININIEFDEDNSQELPDGNDKQKLSEKDKEIKEIKEIEDKQISFNKDVLPFIIPLSCILTIGDNNNNFIEILDNISKNKKLLEIFEDQSFIWWNKKDIITLINKIVSKYIKKNSDTYNIVIQFKMSLKSLIDKPKELLEYIDNCLKPKDLEKKKYGEVFTPMNLVNEMLDKLDEYYNKENGKSIFTEKNFKWFDPANGMGNFPIAVYMKLMNGLQNIIKDEKDRKKHILENMLYMSELNKKNVYISRQIFDINNEYKLNLYQGDSLNLDIEKEWGIKAFDIVFGNPPYNKGGIRSHTGKQLGEKGVKNETIWTKFIEKGLQYLKPNGYLLYINPLSWLKKSHSLHNTMLEKHIVWMKLWDNSQSKEMINADIPLSLYILQNSINTNKKKTEITSILKRRNLTTTSIEYLNKAYSIPLAYHSIFNKLVNFIETNKLKLEYKTKTIKSSGTKTKIPSTYKLEDMLAIDTYTINDGIMVKKTSETHPDANKKKLIIANKASFNGVFIDDGKLSLTGNHKFYIVGDKLELLMKMLNYKIIDIIGHYTKYGQDFLDSEAFTYLPDIRKLGIKNITEIEFYKLIGLTKDEIKFIGYKD
jgi:hypothetical protein